MRGCIPGDCFIPFFHKRKIPCASSEKTVDETEGVIANGQLLRKLHQATICFPTVRCGGAFDQGGRIEPNKPRLRSVFAFSKPKPFEMKASLD